MKNLSSKFAVRAAAVLPWQNIQTVLVFAAVAITSQANALVYSVTQGDSVGFAKAITLANASPEADVIELAAGVYALAQEFKGKESFVALPVITGELVIRGAKVELRAMTWRSGLRASSRASSGVKCCSKTLARSRFFSRLALRRAMSRAGRMQESMGSCGPISNRCATCRGNGW